MISSRRRQRQAVKLQRFYLNQTQGTAKAGQNTKRHEAKELTNKEDWWTD